MPAISALGKKITIQLKSFTIPNLGAGGGKKGKKNKKRKREAKQKKVSCVHLHVFVCTFINISQSVFACYLLPATHLKAEASRDRPQRAVFT